MTTQMTFSAEIRELSAQPAVGKHLVTDASGIAAAIDRTFPELFARLSEAGVDAAGPPFTRYLSTGERFELQLGVPVPAGTSAIDGVESISLPAGRAAVLRYFGPYDGLAAACESLGAWVGEQGEQAGGAFWEAYVTDPREQPDPAKRLTEIFLPVD